MRVYKGFGTSGLGLWVGRFRICIGFRVGPKPHAELSRQEVRRSGLSWGMLVGAVDKVTYPQGTETPKKKPKH